MSFLRHLRATPAPAPVTEPATGSVRHEVSVVDPLTQETETFAAITPELAEQQASAWLDGRYPED